MRHLMTALCMAAAAPAAAQETSPGPSLGLELNAAESTEAGCRLTFVVENGLGAALDTAVFEAVLFDGTGTVERLTLFDMQALPEGRMRVRQFDLTGLVCSDLGRVLINGVHACAGDGIDAATCESALQTESRLDGVEVLG
ncbi:MAG: hypothetical protein AAGA70_11375 [Pseudomonadota bacterium]